MKNRGDINEEVGSDNTGSASESERSRTMEFYGSPPSSGISNGGFRFVTPFFNTFELLFTMKFLF